MFYNASKGAPAKVMESTARASSNTTCSTSARARILKVFSNRLRCVINPFASCYRPKVPTRSKMTARRFVSSTTEPTEDKVLVIGTEARVYYTSLSVSYPLRMSTIRLSSITSPRSWLALLAAATLSKKASRSISLPPVELLYGC